MLETSPTRRRAVRAVLAVLLVAAGVAVALRAPGAAREVAETLRGLGWVGAAALAGVYVAGTVLFVPAPLVHLVTGFALGPAVGIAIALPASLAGSCTAFALGRSLVHEAVRRLAARAPALAQVEQAAAGNGFRLVLLLRLSQVAPFAVLNYVLGASRISFRDFAAASALGGLPTLVVQVWAGSLVADAGDLLSAGHAGGAAALLLAAIGAAALVVLAAGIVRRLLRGRAPAAPGDPR